MTEYKRTINLTINSATAEDATALASFIAIKLEKELKQYGIMADTDDDTVRRVDLFGLFGESRPSR